jgi:Uri superfamily endonuclease
MITVIHYLLPLSLSTEAPSNDHSIKQHHHKTCHNSKRWHIWKKKHYLHFQLQSSSLASVSTVSELWITLYIYIYTIHNFRHTDIKCSAQFFSCTLQYLNTSGRKKKS